MIQEFIVEVESGFGFIFEQDIPKYWKEFAGVEIAEDELADLKIALAEYNLLK